jgi:hypothetical protein
VSETHLFESSTTRKRDENKIGKKIQPKNEINIKTGIFENFTFPAAKFKGINEILNRNIPV